MIKGPTGGKVDCLEFRGAGIGHGCQKDHCAFSINKMQPHVAVKCLCLVKPTEGSESRFFYWEPDLTGIFCLQGQPGLLKYQSSGA